MEYLQDAANICLSGGADGADIEWGRCAELVGQKVIHWSFSDHRSAAPEHQLIRLNDEQLNLGNDALANAATALEKSPPKRPYIAHLLQRNYYQVAWSRACFAVTFLDAVSGTAWAITMFKQLHPETRELYLFCQNKDTWFQIDEKGWVEIDCPPRPTGIWAGIGSRDLRLNGRNAIRKLMGCNG